MTEEKDNNIIKPIAKVGYKSCYSRRYDLFVSSFLSGKFYEKGRKTVKHTVVYIDGMTCINCQTRIWKALRSTPGITDITVSYEQSQAEFSYDPQQITLEEIGRLIEDLGYQVIPTEKLRRKRFLQAVGEFFVIALLLLVLQHWGILNRLAPVLLLRQEWDMECFL